MTETEIVSGFMRTDEVLSEPQLTPAEKRAVLASWASDVHAVPGAPALRQLANGVVVRVDDVLRALRSLDGGDGSERATSGPYRWLADRRARVSARPKSSLRRRWSDDDDDDPPPCPAVVGLPPAGPLCGGAAADPGLAVAA